MNINQVLSDLRSWIDYGGNPEPSRQISFPNPKIKRPANRRLRDPDRELLIEITDAMVDLVEGWQRPTERDKKVLSVLRGFAAAFRNPSAIITPVDAFNCVGWWIYLCICEPDKRSESIDELIDKFFALVLNEHLEYIHVRAVDIKRRDLVPVSTPIPVHQLNQSYRDLIELSSEVSFAPQVLTEGQAFRLFGDLSGCEVIVRTLADGLYLLHGLNPTLISVHRAMRMVDLLDLTLLQTAESVRAAILLRRERLKLMVSDVPGDIIVFQFAEASDKPPFRDDLFFLHSLYHFAEPFVHLQRRTADVAVGRFFEHRLSAFTQILLSTSSDYLHTTAEHISHYSETKLEVEELPFGNIYHLSEALQSRGSQEGVLSLETLEAVCGDAHIRLVKSKQSKVHKFFDAVATEMIERWGYRIGELYWKKVGFIASNDVVDDELQEIGGMDNAIAALAGQPDVSRDTNSVGKNLGSERKWRAAKRPKFVFEEEYAKWTSGEEPPEEKLKQVFDRADELIAKIQGPNGHLGTRLGSSLGGIPCPTIEDALVGRLMVFWTAVHFPDRRLGQVKLGYPPQPPDKRSAKDQTIEPAPSKAAVKKSKDPAEALRESWREWGLSEIEWARAKQFEGWKHHERDFVNDPKRK